MTREQAEKELAEIEPKEAELWKKSEAAHQSVKVIDDEWGKMFSRKNNLKTFLAMLDT